MRKSPVLLLACAAFMFAMLTPAFCQQAGEKTEIAPQYSLGDQTFALNAGLFLPLFFMSWAPAAAPTNLSPGGVGSLQWQAYVTPDIRVGAEFLGGFFAFSPNMNTLYAVSCTAKASYIFTAYPFEIPVFLGAGVNLVKYQDGLTFDPVLKPGASFYWIFNSSWSFGVNFTYWWDMMFAAEPEQSRVGNFLEISLSALYHF